MRPLLALVACAALGCAGGDSGLSQQECSELSDRITGRLEELVQSGTLVGSAEPCGPDGVASRPEASFDSRTPLEQMQSIESEFADLCGEFDAECSK